MRLEFKLQQTNCRKADWKSTECKVKPNGVSEGMCVHVHVCQVYVVYMHVICNIICTVYVICTNMHYVL